MLSIIPLLVLDVLYLRHELLAELVILILIKNLNLSAQRFEILHERGLPHDGIVLILLLPCGCGPRLPNLSTTRGIIATTAITIIIVFRITHKVVKIVVCVWPSLVVVSSVPRSRLRLHNLINHLLELFKFEVLLSDNLLILILLLPKLITVSINALYLRIYFIF